MEALIDRKPGEVLPEFLAEVGRVCGVSLSKDMDLAALEHRWYDGKYDFSIYEDPGYFMELWRCWKDYSRQYLRELRKEGVFDKLSCGTILDLGCGMGYTTAVLQQAYPGAGVTGTNLKGTLQYQLCERVAGEYGFEMSPDGTEAGPVDLIFASEYFEHFQEPITHLLSVLKVNRPKYLIIANAFGTTAAGHFHQYLINGEMVASNKVNKVFSQTLMYKGYRKLKTSMWNNRPNIWVGNSLACPLEPCPVRGFFGTATNQKESA